MSLVNAHAEEHRHCFVDRQIREPVVSLAPRCERGDRERKGLAASPHSTTIDRSFVRKLLRRSLFEPRICRISFASSIISEAVRASWVCDNVGWSDSILTTAISFVPGASSSGCSRGRLITRSPSIRSVFARNATPTRSVSMKSSFSGRSQAQMITGGRLDKGFGVRAQRHDRDRHEHEKRQQPELLVDWESHVELGAVYHHHRCFDILQTRMTERETLEFDVVFVGAGPANLSGALHLARLVKQHNETAGADKLGDIEIAVIEKGATVGAHILSGAVMDPKALSRTDSRLRRTRRAARIAGQRRSLSLSHTEARDSFADNSAAAEKPRLLHRFTESSDRVAWREV